MILSIERIEAELVKLGDVKKATRKCSRCKGNGLIPCYYYRDSGICYKCRGKGKALTLKESNHNDTIEALNELIKYKDYLEKAYADHVIDLEVARESKWPKMEARSAELALLDKCRTWSAFIERITETLDKAKIPYDKVYDIEEWE